MGRWGVTKGHDLILTSRCFRTISFIVRWWMDKSELQTGVWEISEQTAGEFQVRDLST